MTIVKDVLSRKQDTVSIRSHSTVIDALRVMAEKNIGSVVVTENGRYMGLMTERDYSRKIILMGKHSDETTAGEIISTNFPRITPESSVDECMLIMSENNIRYLPVFDVADQLRGIISMSDVVYETIYSQRETIEQLHSYIQST